MVSYFSVGVRAVLHSVKDLIEALLDPSRQARLNGLTGMVSAESGIHGYRDIFPLHSQYLALSACTRSAICFDSGFIVMRI